MYVNLNRCIILGQGFLNADKIIRYLTVSVSVSCTMHWFSKWGMVETFLSSRCYTVGAFVSHTTPVQNTEPSLQIKQLTLLLTERERYTFNCYYLLIFIVIILINYLSIYSCSGVLTLWHYCKQYQYCYFFSSLLTCPGCDYMWKFADVAKIWLKASFLVL